MKNKAQSLVKMYTATGEFLGVFIPPELWGQIKAPVQEAVERLTPPQAVKEPLADLELLKQHWDFQYPVDTDVQCKICGAETPDWAADDPRKFLLKAASLGGLVSYECQTCKARVKKMHFKREICVECVPCPAKACK